MGARKERPLVQTCGAPYSKAMIRIHLNGEPMTLETAMSLAALAAHLELDPARIAVERNREIVARSTLDSVMVADGDCLEIVHFVGGG